MSETLIKISYLILLVVVVVSGHDVPVYARHVGPVGASGRERETHDCDVIRYVTSHQYSWC